MANAWMSALLDWVELKTNPPMATKPGVRPTPINRAALPSLFCGQKTFWSPTVMNPTVPQRQMMMKQRVIFSRHACCFCLSSRPPTERRRTPGAQKVRIREKSFHGSKPPEETGSAAPMPGCGVMRGTGATLRSGLVSVFALRTVAWEASWVGRRVVGIGTSEISTLCGYFEAIRKGKCCWSSYVEARSRGEKQRMDVENDTMERKGWTGKFVGADVEARTERGCGQSARQTGDGNLGDVCTHYVLLHLIPRTPRRPGNSRISSAHISLTLT